MKSHMESAKSYGERAENQNGGSEAEKIYISNAMMHAAIAQAEAAERQAAAMERIAAMLESTLSPAAFNRRFIGVETLDKAF